MTISFLLLVCVGLISAADRQRKVIGIQTLHNDMFRRSNTACCRALAALSIIFGHVKVLFTDTTSLLPQIDLGWHWVALFFLLSGYGVAYGNDHKEHYMREFLPSRLIKIGVPFVIAHVIYFGIKTAGGSRFTLRNVLWGLIGQTTIVDHSWYPVAAVFMYLIFWCVWKLTLQNKTKILLAFLSCAILTYVEWSIFKGDDWWYISNLAFPLGIFLYYLNKWKRIRPGAMIWIGIVVYVFATAMIPAFHILLGEYTQLVYVISSNLSTAAMAVGSISITAILFGSSYKIMNKLGNISYEMYLMHGLAVYLLRKTALVKIPVAFLIGTILLTVMISVPMHKMDQYFIRGLLNRNSKQRS